MKRLSLLIIFAAAFISLAAQNEADFAATFMKRFGDDGTLSCSTISPTMMERLLQSEEIELDEHKTTLLKNIRSVRVVQEKTGRKDATLYNAAAGMLDDNPKRYHLRDEYDGKKLYIRQNGKTILEIILLARSEGALQIVDITGLMDNKIIQLLTKRVKS